MDVERRRKEKYDDGEREMREVSKMNIICRRK